MILISIEDLRLDEIGIVYYKSVGFKEKVNSCQKILEHA